MAQVQNGQDVHGIKLFGKTITLQNRSSQVKEEPIKDDQMVEKRPDRIIPCPRCKSMETKFCYFNNYNVKQPRHFCKGCQRYWTAGGALRNVPVGAGRRKTKPPCQGMAGLPEGCIYEGSDVVHQFELDGVVEEWHVAAEQGGFHQVFPVLKRRRSGSGGQPCS